MAVGDRREDIMAWKVNRIRTIGVTYGYGSKKEILIQFLIIFVIACLKFR